MASAWADGTTVMFRVPDPGYRPPGWLTVATVPGRGATFEVPAGSPGAAIGVRTWAPADAGDDEVLPLLVVHDGPDMHNYTAWRDGFDPHLTRLLGPVCG